MAGTLVILGGCGCIGRALVSSALEADYTPVVLDLRASIAAHQMSVPCLPVDASEPKSLRAAAAKLDDGLAGFVNLCGFMTAPTPVMDQTTNTWRHVIDGNLNAAFYAAQAIAPKLRTGAAMVLTGSGLGHYARPGFGPYAISKAGIAALTRQLAMEMCVLAQPVTSDRMQALGVVNILAATGADVMTPAHALPDRIALGPRGAQGTIRRMVATAYDQSEAAQLDLERDAMAHAFGTAEAQEGITAFLEKRSPNFG